MWQEIEKGAADEIKIQEVQALMGGVKKKRAVGEAKKEPRPTNRKNGVEEVKEVH